MVRETKIRYTARLKTLFGVFAAMGLFSAAHADPAPGVAAFSGVTTSQIQANWTQNGDPGGSTYIAILSTGPSPSTNNFGGNQSSTTLNFSAIFSGLSLNTTYYVDVQETFSAFTTLGGTATLSVVPTASPPTGITSSQVAANWGANSNPVGTSYFCEISTDSGFAIITASTITVNTTFTFSPLISNTLYFMDVQAINQDGLRTTMTPLTSTATLVNSPGSAFTNVTSGQLQVTWSANGNPPDTQYQVVLSTGIFAGTNNFGGNQSSTTVNLSAVFSGLMPNTAYFADVQALGIFGEGSGFSSLGFTVSLANAPTSLATSGITSSGMTANWGANSNPAGTNYTVQISADPTFATVLQSISTTATSQAFSSLSSNITYYMRVEAVNQDNEATVFTALPSATTLAAGPGVSPFSNVSAAQLQANWTANGNPAGTTYLAILSTGASPSTNGLGGNVSSSTVNVFAIFASLQPNTTYFVDVNAVGGAYTALGSTVTFAHIPVTASFSGVTTSQIQANWGANGNPAGTSYQAILSSGPNPETNNFGGNVSSTTVNLFAIFSGLQPNTTYFVDVTAGNATFEALGSTATLANAPTSLVPSGVTESQIVANWGSNSNPAGSNYLVQISTDPGFSVLAEAQQTNGTSATLTGLLPLTTYYLEVQAINWDNLPTTFTLLPSTMTWATPPGILPFSNVSTSQIQANWTTSSNPVGTTYLAIFSTAPSPSTNGFGDNVSSATANIFAIFSGLGLNQNFYVDVQAIPPSGPNSRFAALGSTSTLANPPTGGSLTSVTGLSITATWNPNSNPSGTLYLLEASTDSGFATIDASSEAASTTLPLTGLQPLTTYFVQVQAINNDGIGTTFLALPSTVTLQIPPTAPSLSATMIGTSSITWSWTASARVDNYDLLTSTGGDLSGLLPSSTLSYTETSLIPNTPYDREINAINTVGNGVSPSTTVYTLADAPTSAVVSMVGSSSITLSWSENGNPAGTTYVAQEWQAGGSTTTLNVTSADATFTNLSPVQNYFFDVYAVNGSSVATAATTAISTATVFQQSVTGNIGPAGGTLIIYGPYGPITVVFPPGCFPYLVEVTLSIPSSYPGPTSYAAQLSGTNVGVQIDVDPPLQPAVPTLVSITMAYEAINVAGLDATQLLLSRFDTTANVWVPLVSGTNPTAKTTNGTTPHLSMFQMMGSPAPSSLSKVLIYPNPFRPSQGDTTVNFTFLPANAHVRLYTLTGELVKDLYADATGMAHWDTTNRSGKPVASGVYFVLIEGSGDRETLKVAVQR